MANSILEQYRISDFLEWNAQNALKLNPRFQRRAVWTKAAKVFLIDTILRRFPIPKVFIRTKIDVETRSSFREVVDGQQRLRAIIEFAGDEFALTQRATGFNGMTYSSLPDELKEIFLTYPIAVEQLVNANDDAVLEMFARLNSYNIPLSAAEIRHAKYQGAFKWAAHEAAKRWKVLWEDYGIVSLRQRLRMREDALMAEMLGVLLEGVQDGSNKTVNELYGKYEDHLPDEAGLLKRLDDTLGFIDQTFKGIVAKTPLAKPANFLLLFAAVAHGLHGIPAGGLGDKMPAQDGEILTDFDQAQQNLATLARALEDGQSNGNLAGYVQASKSGTLLMDNRVLRFRILWRALSWQPLAA